MTNPYVAPGNFPRRDPEESIRRHPAWHAKPSAHVALSDRDIEALLQAHDNDACRRAGCALRLYLLDECGRGRKGDSRP
ncbi:hypothetical protein [Nocardia sp. NPDC004711]